MKAILVTGQSNADGTAKELSSLLPHISVFNAAVGGSSIRDWQKGETHYQNALDLVLKAKATEHVFIGWFHMQGERETINKSRALSYRRLTVRFFRTFSSQVELQNTQLVFGQLGSRATNINRPYWSHVQNAQANISKDFPNWKIIITKDIVPYLPPSGPHWGQAGYIEIANRLIKALEIT